VRCVAITGNRFSARDLRKAGATATVDEVAQVEAALAALS
jgi:hypothetical protein